MLKPFVNVAKIKTFISTPTKKLKMSRKRVSFIISLSGNKYIIKYNAKKLNMIAPTIKAELARRRGRINFI
ncbi:hypothetical protein OAU47_04870 [Pelagibacterales bacterium]|nr:hypothetical protein [Pelagibacterales bacterium]